MADTTTTPCRRVFILGAGFSKPSGFPLATDLTDEVLYLLRRKIGDDSELVRFSDYVRRLHQWIAQSGVLPKLNIEEFYEYAATLAEGLMLEQHREPVGRDKGETSAYQAKKIKSWLSSIDEQLAKVLLGHDQSARLGPVDRFVSALRPDDTVVTFNYDRLVERCLSKRGLPWSFGLEDAQAVPPCTSVLKMHGSFDWVCFRRGEQESGAEFRRLFSKRDVNRERTTLGDSSTGEPEYDFELFHIRDDGVLNEFVQHPHFIQRDYRWALAGLGPRKRVSLIPGLGVVWERARRALYEAEQIVIVGFSFSAFDRLAQIEFARVAAGRDEKSLPPARVCVIDPALIERGGVVPPEGQSLIQRIKAAFRSATPIGMLHQEFDWSSLR